jgi:hypothetical protein
MMTKYAVVAGRIRDELASIEKLVARTEGAIDRAKQNPRDQDYYLAAAALDMHSFYTGVERLLQLIANDIDGSLPSSPHWHQDLLAQLSLELTQIRNDQTSPPLVSGTPAYCWGRVGSLPANDPGRFA